MKSIKNIGITIASIFIAVLFLTSCESNENSNPLETENQSLENFVTIELYNNDELVAIANESGVFGNITAQLNQKSDAFKVEFYDANGKLINNQTQDYNLSWKNDANFVTFEQHGQWEFVITGKKRGETSFSLAIDNETREVYASPAIPLKVE